MAFDSLGEFLAMGRHGLYVWLAYGVSVGSVVALVVAIRARNANIWQRLDEEESD